MKNTITLTNAEYKELTRRASSRTDQVENARRAHVILLLTEGQTWDGVCDRIERSRRFVASWNKRFVEQRIAGLYNRHSGQVATVPGSSSKSSSAFYPDVFFVAQPS